MAKRSSFLIRIDPAILESLRGWADDEMRSVNAQIEYVLRDSLARAGRLPGKERKNKERDAAARDAKDAPDEEAG